MFTIYLAHPMTGLTTEEVTDYYSEIKRILADMGYCVLHPMVAKGVDLNGVIRPTGEVSSVCNKHAVIERDSWMVNQADVVYLDLSGSSQISIGCMMELAWSYILKKHTIVVMPKGNIHEHYFSLEASDIIFETNTEAINYLKKLAMQEI